jgi:hypothetical protein
MESPRTARATILQPPHSPSWRTHPPKLSLVVHIPVSSSESKLVALSSDGAELEGWRIATHNSNESSALGSSDSSCMRRRRLTRTDSLFSNPALTASIAPIGTADIPCTLISLLHLHDMASRDIPTTGVSSRSARRVHQLMNRVAWPRRQYALN